MNIETLKKKIENKELDYDFTIFKISDINFIPLQYLDNIKKLKSCEITYLNNESKLIPTEDIFGFSNNDYDMKVLFTDELNIDDIKILDSDNTFVVCKKIKEEELYKDNIVYVPKLESWQIKDYVYSLCEGVNTKYLDKLIDICKNDIFRLEQEINKLNIFSEEDRQKLFQELLSENMFDDLSEHNIFDMSNAIIKKDYSSLRNLYLEIDNIDCEPLGLLTTLINNFRNIIFVQLGNNSSAEKYNMTTKQFWEVKYNCGFYKRDELIKIFNFLTDIDRQIKTGNFPMEILVDYIITKVLSV